VTPADAQKIIADAKGVSSSAKPLIAEMITALMEEAAAVESFETRKLEIGQQSAPSDCNIRKIVVLDHAIRFLCRIEENQAAVARAIRDK